MTSANKQINYDRINQIKQTVREFAEDIELSCSLRGMSDANQEEG